MSVARSASGEGFSLFCSSLARMNQSIFSLRPALGECRVFDFRLRLRRHGLEGPPFAARSRYPCPSWREGAAPAAAGVSSRGSGAPAAIHCLEGGDLLIRQLAGGRHAKVGLVVAEGLEQPAGCRVAGDDHGAAVAALLQAALGVEHQAAHRRFQFGRVAPVALVGKNRANFFFEELRARGLRAQRRGQYQPQGKSASE